MTTKRLYLDVDGVLNAFPYDNGQHMRDGVFDYASPWDDDWQRGVARDYIITWSPTLVDHLNEALAHPDGPELHWTTTWEDNAPEFIRPLLGIEIAPEREFVVHPGFKRARSASILWKKASIMHRVETMRDEGQEPLAWVHIDDELQEVYDDWYDIKKYSEEAWERHNGLIIGPTSTFGITPEQWGGALQHWGI